VRFFVRKKMFNGVGRGPVNVAAGKTAALKVTMPAYLVKRSRRDRVLGSVTFVVTVASTNGASTVSVRRGLRR
jgi:hypothetical protein